MALPDQLADLERKVSARFSAALAEMRQEMRRAVEAQAQRASSAMLSDLDAIRPLQAQSLLDGEDLLQMTRAAGGEARLGLARGLHKAFVDFDRARSQDAVLDALLDAAQAFGDHAALWLMRPTEIVGWASRGFAGDPIAGRTLAHQVSPALARLANGRGCVLLGAAEAAGLAQAAELASPARALFLPLVLRDRVAAALYVDSTAAGEFEIEALQLVTLAAAQRLELQALATRTYTPTLFLDDAAPASEGGLSLWDPAAPASSAGSGPDAPAAAAAELSSEAPPDYAWEESPVEVAAEPPAEEFQSFPAPPASPESEPLDAAAEPPLAPLAPLAPSAAKPPEVAGEEIAWQLEEADETALLGSAPAATTVVTEAAAIELPDFAPPAAPAWASATPTHEIPVQPPVAASAIEWQEVEETTAPHATLASNATQRFVTPAATNEFPQPAGAAADLAAPAASAASTIAFVPPAAAFEADVTDDATVRIQRSALYPSAPPAIAPAMAPLPPLLPEPELPAAPPRPPAMTPAPVASVGQADDEPTISRGPRTTEVAPPADLQGPGWAFSSTRAARATGDNALHEEARRLARLLVSEIKLYNEDQVEEGRHNRDIYHRLKDDIDRSRQIYEERVHESVRSTTDYFQQELIRSLAGGDPRALGI